MKNRRFYEYTWLQLSHIWQRGQIHIKEKAVFLINSAGKTGCPCQRMKLTCVSTTLHKINIKWKKGLNVKPEMVKVLEDKLGIVWRGLGVGKNFLNRTPLKPTIDTWVLYKTNKKKKRKEKEKMSSIQQEIISLVKNATDVIVLRLVLFKVMMETLGRVMTQGMRGRCSL